jgi:hypothetical protein
VNRLRHEAAHVAVGPIQSHRRTRRGSDQGFCPLTLPERASGVIPGCEASGTRSIPPSGGTQLVRDGCDCEHHAVGGWVDGMANTREPSNTS